MNEPEKKKRFFNSQTDAFLKDFSRLFRHIAHWGVNDNCYELNSIELDAEKKERKKGRKSNIKGERSGIKKYFAIQ